jgi:hypothetical protein
VLEERTARTMFATIGAGEIAVAFDVDAARI